MLSCLGLAALLGELLAAALGLGGLAAQAIPQLLGLLLVALDLAFRTSTCARSATSSTRWLSAVTELSSKLRGDLGELGLRRRQRALRSLQRAALGRELVLGSASSSLSCFSLALEREQRRGLLAELELEPADGLALLADLGELARGLGLHLLDAHFEPARRHGEFGAQLILVGLDFRHRQRRQALRAGACVRRTARACTSGMTPMTSKPATRKPIPKNMIGSIMDHAS